MSNDRDDRTADALRRALSAEAQAVSPAGDGLAKIQRRVASRDARWRWMRPALAGSAAVAVIAAGVGGYAIAHRGSGAAIVKVGPANSGTPTPATPVIGTAFYGVQGGKIAEFDAITGAKEGSVPGSDAEGAVSEVRQFGDSLYFTAKSADCLTNIYFVAPLGGTPRSIATADPGYGITGFDVSPQGRLVYFESGCGDQAGKGALVFPQWGHGPEGHEVSFPSLPPVIEGDPVWESDGVHVDAFVRAGMEGYLARYDSSGGDNPQPDTNACPGFDIDAGLPNAIAMGPDGNLWVASQTGTSMQVVSCTGSQPTVEFTVSGNDTPASLSINSSGEALLVGESGKVWKWTGTGDATELSSATGVTSVAW